MSHSVPQWCETIERLQLLSSRDLEALRSRWFRPDRVEVNDVEKFRRWLVANKFLTPFAAAVLARGKGDNLVLNQYRVRDQVPGGPLAGAYLATDPLHKPVVIQVLARTVADDPVRRQKVLGLFQAALGLNHPNVCRILDHGQARGLYYLVRDYDDASPLAAVLARRNQLPHEQAARIFALACEGLRALHEHGLPGGVLNADCILLANTGKGRAQRTVRILVAAVRGHFFDAQAIGGDPAAMPEEIHLAAVPEAGGDAALARPADDLLRLGHLFYRCVAGREPFPADLLPQPGQPASPLPAAQPLAEAAPDVPAVLADIVDHMIAPDPAKRPKSAAHVAKALRVFLRAEEEGRAHHEEEHVVMPEAAPAVKVAPAPAATEEGEEEEAEQEERRSRRQAAEPAGTRDKLRAVWEDVRPSNREWLYFAAGAVAVVAVTLLVQLIVGFHFVHVVLLATGAALSLLVERLVRWWEGRREPVK